MENYWNKINLSNILAVVSRDQIDDKITNDLTKALYLTACNHSHFLKC